MISAMGVADHASIKSPIDGTMIYGASDYKKHMKKHGVVHESDARGEATHQRNQQIANDKKARKNAIITAVNRIKG
jgi:hypothetical protein